MSCAEWSAVGSIPTIVFTVYPDALHPLSESTAATVSWKDPLGAETVISSPDGHLVQSTAMVVKDGVDTLATYWTFTFPSALTVGSRRHPYKVKFNSTAGIIDELVIERIVLPSGY